MVLQQGEQWGDTVNVVWELPGMSGMPLSARFVLARDRLAALAFVFLAVAMTVLSIGPLARDWSAVSSPSSRLAHAVPVTLARGVPAGLQSAIRRELGPGSAGLATATASSRIIASATGWTATEPTHALSGTITRSGALTVRVKDVGAIPGLTAHSIGSGVGQAGVPLRVVASSSAGGRLVQQMGPLHTVYEMESNGLEQSFVITKASAAAGKPVVLDLGRAAGWAVADGGLSLTRRTSKGTLLSYGGLQTHDRDGTVIPSTMRIAGGIAEIVVHPSHSSLYPLTIDPTWSTVSTPLATLSNAGGVDGQAFGYAVALSSDGSTAVVGGPYTASSGQDAAYIFHVSSEGSWSNAFQTAVLSTGQSGSDNFGDSVAISSDGTTVYIGARGANSQAGAVDVYHVASSGSWTNMVAPTATLTNSSGVSGDEFGTSVAVSANGTTVLVGASGVSTSAGAAYIFHASSEDSWTTTSTPSATLTDSAAGSNSSFFGKSVALSSDGTTALIGAPNVGSSTVFHASTQASWTTTSTPTATLTAAGGAFNVGWSVALSSDGTTALIGVNNGLAPGAAYVFHVSSEASWATSSTPTATLTSAGASGKLFGGAVSLSADGTTALIGGEGETTSGAAYIFDAIGEAAWTNSTTPSATLTNAADTSADAFASAVTLSSDGTTALLGDSSFNSGTGEAYVFNSSQTPPAPPTPPTPPAPPAPSHGYWLVGSDGGIFTFGNSTFFGSTGSLKLQRPVVGIVPTSDRGGYWLDASDGGVFSYGDTQFYGSIPGLGLHPAGSGLANSLDAPIVGMVPSNDDNGYFMVASDGGVFAFGDARFAGSCPGIGGCSGAAVAVMPDASGSGYWLVTSTGNIYTFGDAPYFGAPQRGTVTSAVATPDGKGYWILLADGEVLGYGDAGDLGSPASANFNAFDPAATIFATGDGQGYWVSSALGKIFAFGDAPNDGDMSGTHLNGSIIAGTGY